MKRALLLTAAGIVALANAFALIHAWRNRAAVTTDITLTQRELPVTLDTGQEDTEVSFNLRWIGPTVPIGSMGPVPWLNRQTLKDLGFDTSVDPAATGAAEFYERQRARRAFVALEYNGPTWQRLADQTEQRLQGMTPFTRTGMAESLLDRQPRLVAVDAARDAERLRARYPDRSSVLIVPAAIAVSFGNAGNQDHRLSGSIQEIPSSIHVPRPFSDQLRQLKVPQTARYRVHLRYGSSYEPWVVSVDFD